MAIAISGTPTQGTDPGTGGGTFTFDNGGGNQRMMLAAIFIRGAAINAPPSYPVNGATGVMTQIGTKTGAGHHLYLYYLLNPDPGSHSFSNAGGLAGSTDVSYSLTAYTGVQLINQTDNSTTGGAVTTSLTTTLTTVADNCWTVLAAADFSQNNSLNAGAGTTARAGFNLNNYSGLFDSNAAITPAGSTSLIVTSANNDNLGTVMASFSPASGSDAFFLSQD